MLDGAQDFALVIIGPQGEIEEWSAGARRILGFGAERVMGQGWEFLFTQTDLAAGLPAQALRRAQESGLITIPATLTRAQGAPANTEVSVAALRPNGVARGYLVIVRER